VLLKVQKPLTYEYLGKVVIRQTIFSTGLTGVSDLWDGHT